MERETPSFTQETVVAGEPVETQVRVWASSSYVRLVMVGETGWEKEQWEFMCTHIHITIYMYSSRKLQQQWQLIC